jgi:outer membrane lipoprotein-sorting protein
MQHHLNGSPQTPWHYGVPLLKELPRFKARWRKTRKLLSVLFAVGTWLLSFPASAATKLSQIQDYLSALSTLEAHFTQWDQAGKQTQGLLQLRRPGYLRMTYKPPSPLLIIADGQTLYFINKATNDISYTPIDQSPAAFLLEQDIDLLAGFEIEGFVEEPNRVKLTLRRKDARDLGTLTLFFHKRPFELIQWIIKDAQGLETIVRLSQLKKGTPIPITQFDPSLYFGR